MAGNYLPWGIVVGVAFGLLWRWEQNRKRSSIGTPIDTSDPLWIAALDNARKTLPRFRELIAGQTDYALIKYPLQTTTAATEHVWGSVLSFTDTSVTVNLETPPIEGKPAQMPPFELQLSQIEDWQVQTTDGRIFGAYTTRAQISYARQRGHAVPSHMLEIEKRLVDA